MLLGSRYSCSLSAVRLSQDDTVVSLLHGAFSRCRSIIALFLSLQSDFNRTGTAVSCQQFQTKIHESLSKKPFSNAPRCKSASYHPCFTLQGMLLQAARSFEQVKKEKTKHGEVPMPGSMLLTNVSNSAAPVAPIPGNGLVLCCRFCEPGFRQLGKAISASPSSDLE